jgi:hypothetical protein
MSFVEDIYILVWRIRANESAPLLRTVRPSSCRLVVTTSATAAPLAKHQRLGAYSNPRVGCEKLMLLPSCRQL